MSWPAAILAGVVCGLAGAGLTMMAADSIVRIFRISNFEGAAGYMVVFLLVPLGFLVGLTTGIAIMRVNAPSGAGMFALYQVLGILVTAGLLTAGYGAAYLSRERPPRIGGLPLALEVEIRYRPTVGEDPRDEVLTASLYATDKDNRYLEVDLDRAESRDGWIVTPCLAGIGSRSHSRILTITREGERPQPFVLPLRPMPTVADTTWTEWLSPGRATGSTSAPVDPSRACEVRYRLRIGL